MHERRVSFFSQGSKLSGILRLPDKEADNPIPGIVQGPGWLGLMDAKLYVRYHEALTEAGFAVLVFDYRGFGDSEGDRTAIVPANQLEDLISAVTFMAAQATIDEDRIGVFGSGGTGGGNAVMLAAHDSRIRCAVSQVPVADGEDWLKRMRPEHEWAAFLDRLADDQTKRVMTGVGAMVHPREEIMIPTPERRQTTVKKDVDGRIPELVSLASAEAIIAYKPVDVVDRISPRALMIIAVEGDTVTPTDHAVALYERAGGPKRLVLQRHTTHYAAYDRYWERVTPMIVEWFRRYLDPADLVVFELPVLTADIEYIESPEANQ
jgi:hypothetical protein